MAGKRAHEIMKRGGIPTREQAIADMHAARGAEPPEPAPMKESKAVLTKLANAADAARDGQAP